MKWAGATREQLLAWAPGDGSQSHQELCDNMCVED